VTYVEVHGLRTWHEVTGAGQPVVLLHGAFAGAASWSGQAPVLADAGYKVHVPERRGHAHTPDVPGPLTYQVMADDTVAYLDGVVGGPAHLVGWSDGAVVALLVAQRRPELVDRLVLQGDRDEVTLEHGAAVATALPNGRLAVLPGTHALPVENPDVVNALLLWFLAGAAPAVDWPGLRTGR